MRRTAFTILALSLLVQDLGCLGGGGYTLRVGDSVYSPRRPPATAGWVKDVSDDMEAGAMLNYRGIYTKEPHSRVVMVRHFDRHQGWSYAVLADTLPVEPGALVEVRGTVIIHQQPIRGTSRINKVNQLKVEDHQILYDTRPLQERARREYRKIREKLQKQISLPGSRLKLREDPDWRVDWLEGEAAVVVAAHVYDLMYAAEAQFLFTMAEQKLEAVYFHEWFKGE